MKFQSILLRNIGAYYGEHNEIDFSTTSDKNVVLIGGKNGAGKTTLLESIRVALFGCITYGYMSESEAYFTKVQSLFNRRAVRENVSHFQIILSYESVENFLPVTYVLSRRWIMKENKTKESFSVQRDGRLLTERDTDNFQNRLREEIPPRLFELCLFDGEDISRVISDGRISEYLNEAAKVLFNLDLFFNLDKDLLQFINTHNGNSHLQIDTSSKEEIEKAIETDHHELMLLSQQITSHNQEMEQFKETLAIKKRDFEMHGGIQKENRDKMILEQSQLESIRKKNVDQIKGFINELLPLYLVRDLIQATSQQMQSEQSFETFERVRTLLHRDQVQSIITNTLTENTHSSQQELATALYENILTVFKPDTEHVIHRASFTQKTEINALQIALERTSVQNFINLYEENAALLERIQELRRLLDTNDNASEFKVLLSEIEAISQTIEQTRAAIELKQQQELHITEQLKGLFASLELENEKLTQLRKSATSFVLAGKIATVSQRFQSIQLRKKLDQVQSEAIKMIQQLFRKKDFITRIYISHENFEMSLYRHQEQIVLERLSAGEKEMLMLSIIWAMFKTTGWRLPLVFDTLLGRLDQDHKRELINHFLPNCGDQVIVLSTDSEITSAQFKDLNHSLSKYYTLEYNVATESVDINADHYFDIYDLELV